MKDFPETHRVHSSLDINDFIIEHKNKRHINNS